MIEHPKGWVVREFSGVYAMFRNCEVGWVKKGVNKVKGWFTGQAPSGTEQVSRAYHKDGKLIWDSRWMRKTTKAWMLLAGVLIVVLMVLVFGWWRKRRQRTDC